jgi:hypothetical protein
VPDGSATLLTSTSLGGTITALSASGPDEAWALSDGQLLHFDGAEFVEIAPLGGSALVRDPSAQGLLIGGRGVSGYASGLITTEVAAPSLTDLWIGAGQTIAVNDRDQVLERDSGKWVEVPLDGTDSVSVDGLSDGTPLIFQEDESGSVHLLQYDGSSLQELPALQEERVWGQIAGESLSDFWALSTAGPSHFDGSVWQLHDWPASAGAWFAPAAALMLASNDVWVVGGTLDGAPIEGGIIAHFDGASWQSEHVGLASTHLSSIAQLHGKLYAAGGFTDFANPLESDWVYYPREPVLYEYAGGTWTKLSIPGILPDYAGSSRAFVAASDSELFFVMQTPHPGVANLLVYDGTTFSERPYPASICQGVFASPDGTLHLLVGKGPNGLLRSR